MFSSVVSHRSKKQAAHDIAGRHAVTHTWDEDEPRLLVCEARELSNDSKTVVTNDRQREIGLTKATMHERVGRNVPRNLTMFDSSSFFRSR